MLREMIIEHIYFKLFLSHMIKSIYIKINPFPSFVNLIGSMIVDLDRFYRNKEL